MELAQILNLVVAMIIAIMSAWYVWSHKHRELESRIESWQRACRDRDENINALKAEMCSMQHRYDSGFRSLEAGIQRDHDRQLREASRKYSVKDYYVCEVGVNGAENKIRVEFYDKGGQLRKYLLHDYVRYVQEVNYEERAGGMWVKFNDANGERIGLSYENYVTYTNENARAYLPIKEQKPSYLSDDEWLTSVTSKHLDEQEKGCEKAIEGGVCVTLDEHRQEQKQLVEMPLTFTMINENAGKTATKKFHDLADQIVYDAKEAEEIRQLANTEPEPLPPYYWNPDAQLLTENGLPVRFVDYIQPIKVNDR